MAGNVSAWVEGREGGEGEGEREGGWWEGGERDRWKGEPIGLVGFGQPMPIFKRRRHWVNYVKGFIFY